MENFLFRALARCRLIEDHKTCGYSRCGRTDKGVSALGNVVALSVRSREGHKLGEYDYIKMINANLPEDIRVLGC